MAGQEQGGYKGRGDGSPGQGTGACLLDLKLALTATLCVTFE